MDRESNRPFDGRDRRRKVARPATRERLEKAALAYLERYASSAENLRRVLMRRVDRSARLCGTDRAEGAGWVDALIERYRRSGLIDDRTYAEAATRSLRRRGGSARMVRMKLKAKGVDADTVSAALDAASEGDADSEHKAAKAYARRRRLGPYAPAATRKERRMRDLAALARAGFSYDIARRVVDGEEN
ncbi:MAG: RecX family transcriptional regulator [Alphaproteobacteria bacterium]|nr:RecX family transcriptional regulator [Alphaproteobacteria bacterium]